MTMGGTRTFALGFLLHSLVSACGTVARSDDVDGNLGGDSGAPGGTGGVGAASGGSAGVSGDSGTAATSGTSGSPSTGGTAGSGATDGGGTVSCGIDADCVSPTPACNPDTNSCVECLPNGGYCAGGLYCTGAFACEIGCEQDSDCIGSTPADAGARDAGGALCVQNVCVGCTGNVDCPRGTVCNSVSSQCEPGCADQTDCPAGFDCCSGQCVNTLTSEDHCGVCDSPCAPPGVGECIAGLCQVTGCQYGFGDCDNNMLDGCEAEFATDPANCSACGNACVPLPNAEPACSAGRCVLGPCEAGYADCEGDPSNGCETNILSNAANCGTCGMVCDLPHASSACTGGTCTIASCDAGFANCDGDPANGCEVNVVSNVSHCGQCGNACNLPGGASGCVAGQCEITQCAVSRGDCDGDPTNGCETNLDTNALHCGQCGSACPSNESCSGGVCWLQCGPNFADCDLNAANGCETNLRYSVDHCGMCGNVCPAVGGTPQCWNGYCANPCISPLGDCDANATNGCETNLSTSVQNCGTCGNACVLANATPACVTGICQIQSCNPGYSNCNGLSQDGCEINLLTSNANCGACGAVCSSPNGNAYCSGGSCVMP